MGLAVLAALGAEGCGNNYCVDRGSSTSYQGSTSYDGQLVNDAGAPITELAGTTTGTFVMDDYQPFGSGSCDDDGVAFTVRFGSCVVVVQETSDNHDTGKGASGDFLGATAAVTSSLGCTLDLAEGAAVIDVQSGTLQVGPSSVELTLEGDIDSLNGVAVDGQIQWVFTGQ
jgi:hypothetical protein